jgi:hypothetical protein
MNIAIVMLNKFNRVVDVDAIARSSLLLAPLVLAAAVSGKEVWLQASLVTISAYIAERRSGLAPLGVLLHGFAIAAGYLSLLLSLAVPVLFVLFAAFLAMTSIWVTAHGKELRTVGNFIFIPALYLACENAEGAATFNELLRRGLIFLPYLAMAMMPVLLMSYVPHKLAQHANTSYRRHFFRILHCKGPPKLLPYRESMIAVTLSVAIAAAVVELFHMHHGQWVIWSSASVVTGDAISARTKLRDRLIGASVGVPIGILLGIALPHDRLILELVAVVAVLTLVAFHNYPVGFAARCACAAALFIIAGQSAVAATQRLENVVLGCTIGIVLVFAIHAITTMLKARQEPKKS